MTEETLEELKPCPFCGGGVKIEGSGHDCFIRCGCRIGQYVKSSIGTPDANFRRSDTIELWNTRAQDARIKELEEALEDQASDAIHVIGCCMDKLTHPDGRKNMYIDSRDEEIVEALKNAQEEVQQALSQHKQKD